LLLLLLLLLLPGIRLERRVAVAKLDEAAGRG